jgi:hypothetical protein
VDAAQQSADPAGPLRRYEIGKPVEHTTWSFFAPAPAPPAKPPVIRPEIAKALPAIVEIPAELGAEPKREEGASVPAAPAPPPAEKKAVWIVHGMGQQVPFETVDSLAEGLLDNIPKMGGKVLGPSRATQVKFSDPADPANIQVVQRVEIDCLDLKGKNVELHLYEAYWAPLTEGVPKLADVVHFFLMGGLRGFLNCWKPFRRYMFPNDPSPLPNPATPEGKADQGVWRFRIPKRSALAIAVTLLVLLALVAINVVILAAAAAKFQFALPAGWPIGDHWPQLTAIASSMAALLLTFGGMLFLAEMYKFGRRHALVRAFICVLSWFAFWLSVLAVISAGLLMSFIHSQCMAGWIDANVRWRALQFVSTCAILAVIFLCLSALAYRAMLRSKGKPYRERGFFFAWFLLAFLLHVALAALLIAVEIHKFDPASFPAVVQCLVYYLGRPVWVWPFLIAVGKLVRDLLIEYPGDVAVYVTPNQLDRFDETRQKIKQVALDTLTPLYAARNDDGSDFLYSEVAVVGHSLGSVIGYDTLNKLLVLDDLLGNRFDVAGRTAILETFGSPLDKVAFFFNVQGKNSYNIREQLAAAVQPLIQDYTLYRTFPWVNVYSHNDIICGDLKFFDTLTPAPNKVENVRDPDAIIPLIAHVQYWNNSTVWRRLINEIL